MSENSLMIRGSVSEGSSQEGVGARLKRLRVAQGFSQRDLSSPGVSYAYISRIEAGARTPSVKALRKLAQKLSVSVEYLETGRDIREVDARELKLADAELELRLESDTSSAEQKLEEVLADASASGDRVSAARAAIGLGLAAAQRGNHLDAVERLESALEYERVSPHLRPDLYATLGQSYAALGAPDRAVRLFEQCLADVTEATPEDVPLQVRYATFLSYALSDAGDYDRASSIVREALQRAGRSAGQSRSSRQPTTRCSLLADISSLPASNPGKATPTRRGSNSRSPLGFSVRLRSLWTSGCCVSASLAWPPSRETVTTRSNAHETHWRLSVISTARSWAPPAGPWLVGSRSKAKPTLPSRRIGAQSTS